MFASMAAAATATSDEQQSEHAECERFRRWLSEWQFGVQAQSAP